MKKVAAFFICFLVLLSSIGTLTSVTFDTLMEDKESVPSSVSIFEWAPDPNLDTEPFQIIDGESGEFESSYHHSTSGGYNYITMRWEHIANTPLDFGYSSSGRPYSNDNVQFLQDVDWPYDRMPDGARISIEYNFHVTGDFATRERGTRMFECLFSVKYPSGGWARLDAYSEPCDDEYHEGARNLGYSIQYVWDNNLLPTVWDPENTTKTAKLAVVLSPSRYFEEDYFPEDDIIYPWQVYNGTVILSVRRISVEILMENPPDPSELTEPISETNHSDGIGIRSSQMIVVDDSLYAIGSVREQGTHYWGYYQDDYSFTIMRFNQNTDLEWSVTPNWNSWVMGYGIAKYDDMFYVMGCESNNSYYKDVFLAKVSESGDVIWKTSWYECTHISGASIAVSSDGSIYAICHSYLFHAVDLIEFTPSSLRKYDSAGNLLWSRTFPTGYYGNYGNLIDTSLVLLNETSLYVATSSYVGMWDSEGNELWNVTDFDYTISDITTNYDQQLIVGGTNTTHLFLNVYDTSGIRIYNESLMLAHKPHWIEYLFLHDLVCSPNGIIYCALETYRYEDSKKILSFNSDCTFRSLDNLTAPDTSSLPMSIAAFDDDIVYVLDTRVGSYSTYISLAAFEIEVASEQNSTFVTSIVIWASAIILASVISIIIIKKWMK